ncbi:hypothetical protein XBKB1_560008 [Xenorhabdus bovienii str. kraussei Becker Underwood]|uniref:Uncharacterized protein n=1 Tax=Xenorhabdus bovienii str. kraussei Becker Underwood TaxID=1398204 RepID=A0A077Q2Q0_XENBV|nr:hypothetical protein XBKB1_560008 [Xenorhabdus bovienii str. kraussei Becker Underwood]
MGSLQKTRPRKVSPPMHNCTKTPPFCVRARRGSKRAQRGRMDAFIWADREKGKDGRPCRASATLGRAGCIDQGTGGKQRKTNTARLSVDNRRSVRRE